MPPRDLREGEAPDGSEPFETAPSFEAPPRAKRAPEAARPAQPPKRKRRKIVPLLILAGLLAAAGNYGWEWWTTGRFLISTDDAYVGVDMAVMAPKVSGYVAAVPVAETQQVKAGDPVVVIDDGDYRVRLQAAEATLAAKRAALSRIGAQIAQARAAILGAEANESAARASLAQAEADFDRYQRLAKSDFASGQKLEAARAAAETARAAVAARAAEIEEAKAALSVVEASRGEAEAAIAGAEADRAQAQRDLDAATIRAPVDGVIGNLSVTAGDFVAPGARLLAVAPLSAVFIDANFKETQLEALTPGAPVHVEVDAYPGRGFTAHVVGFAPATGAMFSLLPPENATGNFTKVVQRVPVRIEIPAELRDAGWLRPGLSVVVTADRRSHSED